MVASDPAKGVTLADLVNQAGQNRIAINFVWTLVTGFLVMFMQAGFAIVETGLCRAKNANHTMMMNFMVYGFGLFAYWVCGFALQMGGAAGVSILGGCEPVLSHEIVDSSCLARIGALGHKGFFLAGPTYDVGVMVLFLFEMVFMDTALTIVTGTRCRTLEIRRLLRFVGRPGRDHLSDLWQLGVGWRLALQPGRELRLWARLRRLRRVGSGACRGRNHRSGDGHDHRAAYRQIQHATASQWRCPGMTLSSCCSAASFWLSAGSDSIPEHPRRFGSGLRISTIAVDTMLAGWTGSFGALLFMWLSYGKPDASMAGNGLLAGLVAITAPSGYVNTMGACIIGLVAGVLVGFSVEFIDRVLRVDDPVGAISVHGTNGLWGVISVGLFADGTNGVKGLFYGDPTQLVAQLIGVATLCGFVFSLSYIANRIIDVVIGQRARQLTNWKAWISQRWERSAIRSSCSNRNLCLQALRRQIK